MAEALLSGAVRRKGVRHEIGRLGQAAILAGSGTGLWIDYLALEPGKARDEKTFRHCQ